MVSELEILRELTQSLRETENVQEMLQTVVDLSHQLLNVPRVSAWLLDATRTRLLVGARAGMPLHNRPDFEYQLGQGLLGWIAQHVRPIRTADADRDPRFLPRPGMIEKIGSFLGVPLVCGSSCIGALSAVTPEPDYFSLHHEDLLVVVGGLCADRLEVARLSRP